MYSLAVFASGNGSTLQAIINSINSGELNAKIALVISDNSDSYALERAKSSNIPTHIISAKTADNIDLELENVLAKYQINLIVLAGYLKMIGKRVLSKYLVINTHPSLLPKFGGKGMFGMNVHKAVINAKEKFSGATVHYVNSEYDKGNIISQTIVEVCSEDSAEDLSIKVQKAEKLQLVEVIKKFSERKE